jgi:hypothetical protein
MASPACERYLDYGRRTPAGIEDRFPQSGSGRGWGGRTGRGRREWPRYPCGPPAAGSLAALSSVSFLFQTAGTSLPGCRASFSVATFNSSRMEGYPSASDLTPPEVVLSSVVKGVNGNISVVGTAVDAPVFFIFDCRTQPIGANLERFRAIFWLCCPSFPSYLDLIRVSPGEG